MPRPTQDRAEDILAAAKAQFRETGAESTTVDDIAARAGVGKGTVFLYWPSKDRLREAVLLLEVARHFAVLADDLREDPRLLRLGTLVRRQIEACLDNPHMGTLMVEQPTPPPEDHLEPPARALLKIIPTMRAHGIIREVPEHEIVTGVETVMLGSLVRGLSQPKARPFLADAAERLVSATYDVEDVDQRILETIAPVSAHALEDAIDQLVAAASPDRPTTAELRPRARRTADRTLRSTVGRTI